MLEREASRNAAPVTPFRPEGPPPPASLSTPKATAGHEATRTNKEYFELAAKCREDFGPDCVAFVQIGSFFEAMGEHADMMVEHAMVRSFVRGGVRVAGVQVAGHARVVRMLLARGLRVALHEQFEEPVAEPAKKAFKTEQGPANASTKNVQNAKRKGPDTHFVRRRTRVYTRSNPPPPDGDLQHQDDEAPILLSAYCSKRGVGFAALDVSTGRTRTAEVLLDDGTTGRPGGRGLLRLERIGKGAVGAVDGSSANGERSLRATAATRAAHVLASYCPVEVIVATEAAADRSGSDRSGPRAPNNSVGGSFESGDGIPAPEPTQIALARAVSEAARGVGAHLSATREIEVDAASANADHQDELLRGVFGAAATRSMLGVDDSLGLEGSPERKTALCELLRFVRSASPEGLMCVLSPDRGGAHRTGDRSDDNRSDDNRRDDNRRDYDDDAGDRGDLSACGVYRSGHGGRLVIEGGSMRQLDAELLLKMCVQPVTSHGRREMVERLSAPLTSAERIERRLDAVERCLERRGGDYRNTPSAADDRDIATVGDGIRSALKGSPDPVRSFRRLSSGTAGASEWARLVRGCDGVLKARMAFDDDVDRGGGRLPGDGRDRARGVGHASVAAAHFAVTSEVCREVDLEAAESVASSGPGDREYYRSFFVPGTCARIDSLSERLAFLEAGFDAFAAALNDAGGAIGEGNRLVSETVRDEGGSFLLTTPARFKRIKSGAAAAERSRGPLSLPVVVRRGDDGDYGDDASPGTVPVPAAELRHSGCGVVVEPTTSRGSSSSAPAFQYPSNAVTHPRLAEIGEALRETRLALRHAAAERHSALASRICDDPDLRDMTVLLSDEGASLDVSAALAATAARDGLVRPTIMTSEGEGGRRAEPALVAEGLVHPVVVAQDNRETPVGNDVEISADLRGFVLYGLNASGKTTLLKACGLAVVTAQAGWFVSARSASLRPFSALHTRIAATDDLAAGTSLFQNECLEMRRILEVAGPGSLVLGDEPCSSTETLSAASILGAFVESLAASGAKMIVTSHYHEVPLLPGIASLYPSVSVKHLHTEIDADGAIVFDRRLRPGSGSPEYGLLVARAMAMPEGFLRMAEANRSALLGIADRRPIDSALARYLCKPSPDDDRGASDGGRPHSPPSSPGDSGAYRKARKSRYNAKATMATCEECGSATAAESHHMVTRASMTRAGKSGRAQNKAGNLAALCGACHDSIHGPDVGRETYDEGRRAGNDDRNAAAPRRRVMTSAGLKLVDPRTIHIY